MLTVKSIVNTILESKTYILEGDRLDFWIVDPGDVEKIMEIVDKDRVLKGILLTHIHYDHIYGLPALVRIFPSAIIYTNEAGIKALASVKLNLSKYYGTPMVYWGENIKVELYHHPAMRRIKDEDYIKPIGWEIYSFGKWKRDINKVRQLINDSIDTVESGDVLIGLDITDLEVLFENYK